MGKQGRGILLSYASGFSSAAQMAGNLANAMSAYGTKRTYRVAPHMSAFGGKADKPFCTANVCF